MVRRFQQAVVCAALFALALKQAPDQLVGDTKLDLSVAPLRFLGRSLHLWDPTRDFGVTGNQSYGYLWPMGPFFALGHLLALPPWLVQRLWWGVMLSVAFLGLVRLAERLDLGSPTSRLVGGAAFALSPRVLSTLGPISVETLPYCLSPWVLLPLVTGAKEGSPRRAAARSGVAVFCMGAVNAAAVLAALPPAALWLLTRERGARRTSLQRWWVGCVLLATAWWVVPLLLLGKYSPPFLSFIESASTTTSVTSLVEVLRGTSDWVGYLGGSHGPTWPTAFALLTGGTVVLYTFAVVIAGFAGLLRRDLPERLWLVSCLLLGVAAVTAGHLGPFTGVLAGQERHLLDGVLAPFRNVHKFEVVIRLPLVLGLVHLVPRLVSGPGRPQVRRLAVQGAALAAVLGAALPALSTGLAPRAPFVSVPGYWQQTATWLHQHSAEGRALLLPGSAAPDYVWGSSNDEPLQPLAQSEWAVRSAVPLTSPGTIRLLDAVEARLATGTASPGLAADLARAGIQYVVLRNDLAYGAAPATRPLLVHEAVLGSGLTRVKTFGGDVGGDSGRLVDEGLEVPYPAIEVFSVDQPTPRAELHPLSDVVSVAGGPEDLLDLDDRDLLAGRPTVLQTDRASQAASPSVVTDGLRRREVSFGVQADAGTSATLTAGERYRGAAPAHDYLPTGAAAHQTVAELIGARSISVSSSASDADAYGGAERDHTPYAAVDGDSSTSWEPAPLRSTSSWQLRLDAPRDLSGLVVAATGRHVQVSAGGHIDALPADGHLPGLGTGSTITVTGASAISEVSLPGLAVSSTLVTDVGPAGSVVTLDADGTDRRACYAVVSDELCSSDLERTGEDSVRLDRTVRSTASSTDVLSATAVPVPGPALDALLDRGTGVTVTASSSAVLDQAGRPGTVVDGQDGTGWRAAPGDHDPTLTLTWPTPQTVTGLLVHHDASLASSTAASVRVDVGDGQQRSGTLVDGLLSFAPVRTRSLAVHLAVAVPANSLDPYSLQTVLLPVGVSELTAFGATAARPQPETVLLPCGAGPTVRVGNSVLRTAASTTRTALLETQPVALRVCGDPEVGLGTSTRVVATPSPVLRAASLTLEPSSGALIARPAATPDLALPSWRSTSRSVDVPARAAAQLLEVHENANPGWVATLGGQRLDAMTVDGWQQGWLVPAGAAGTVQLRFTPDREFRVALFLGLLLVVGLLALASSGAAGALAPVGTRRTGLVPVVALGGVLLLVGGPLVLALAVVALVLAHQERARTGLALLCLAGAAGLLALHPWPTAHYAGRAGLPQALCVAALVLVWSTLSRPGTRSLRRRAGRSTST